MGSLKKDIQGPNLGTTTMGECVTERWEGDSGETGEKTEPRGLCTVEKGGTEDSMMVGNRQI